MAYNSTMLFVFINVILFALEIIICAILVFYILKADKWALNMQQVVKVGSREIISSIKELRRNLKKINSILNNIKNFKHSLTRKIIARALDIIGILQLFTAKGQTEKIWKVTGLKIIKGFLLGLKMVSE